MRTIAVLGGYGIFGGRVARGLAGHSDSKVRIVGRDPKAGAEYASSIGADFQAADLADSESLARAVAGAHVVIHAAGPFQGSDYRVAEACIAAGAHYLDLADARDFVAGIGALDSRARAKGLLVASGASSVPAVTHAMVAATLPEFNRVDAIHIALAPGNKNPRGSSTIAAILSYLGRPIKVFEEGRWIERFGWDGAHARNFPPPVGRRRVHACDVPDLALFPEVFGARTVRFSAGLELEIFNRALSAFAWLRRRGRLENLPRRASSFRRLSLLLYAFGSRNGALSVWVEGAGPDGAARLRSIALVTDDDGPATPSAPATVLTRKILDQGPPRIGAFPCMGILSLDELTAHLRPLGVWCARGNENGWHTAGPMARS